MSWSSSRIETVARWKQTEQLNYSTRRDGVLNEQFEKWVISRTLRKVKYQSICEQETKLSRSRKREEGLVLWLHSHDDDSTRCAV